LVATPQGEREDWINEFLAGEWEELRRPGPPTQPEKKRCRVEIKKEVRDGELFVLCRSEGRTEKDAAIRQRFEKKMEVDLEKLQKRIATGRLKQLNKIHEKVGRLRERYPRVARYYDIQVVIKNDQLRLEWNQKEEQWKQAEELDGTYLLQTNRVDWSMEEVWKTYIMLTHVESAFRHLKSTLNLRPIFHQREDRGETHIFLIILAYHLLHLIEMTLRKQGEYRCWQTIRKELRSHQVNTIILPATNGEVYKIRKPTVAEKHQREIYEKLNMDPEVNRFKRSKQKYRI
jgi:transposase